MLKHCPASYQVRFFFGLSAKTAAPSFFLLWSFCWALAKSSSASSTSFPFLFPFAPGLQYFASSAANAFSMRAAPVPLRNSPT